MMFERYEGRIRESYRKEYKPTTTPLEPNVFKAQSKFKQWGLKNG